MPHFAENAPNSSKQADNVVYLKALSDKMDKGFEQIQTRLEQIDNVAYLKAFLDKMDKGFEHIEIRFKEIDQRLTVVEDNEPSRSVSNQSSEFYYY